jgi:hypothetical protein
MKPVSRKFQGDNLNIRTRFNKTHDQGAGSRPHWRRGVAKGNLRSFGRHKCLEAHRKKQRKGGKMQSDVFPPVCIACEKGVWAYQVTLRTLRECSKDRAGYFIATADLSLCRSYHNKCDVQLIPTGRASAATHAPRQNEDTPSGT